MKHKVTIAARADIEAAADVVYGVLADYHEGHRQIVSPRFFQDWQVKQGGYGAGTILEYNAIVFGRKQAHRAVVSEPEPGRVLVETEEQLQTTFTVDRLDGNRSHVTITTVFHTSKGLQGVVEQLLMPGMLRPMYKEEIRELEQVAQGKKDEPVKSATKATE
jgi:hypothetical protein